MIVRPTFKSEDEMVLTLLPEVRWLFCSPQERGHIHTALIKPEFPSPQNSGTKDKTKPSKTHVTNQHSKLYSHQWITSVLKD